MRKGGMKTGSRSQTKHQTGGKDRMEEKEEEEHPSVMESKTKKEAEAIGQVLKLASLWDQLYMYPGPP